MPITFKRAGQEAVALENVSFKGVALDKVTFKRAGHEAVTVFEKITQLATPQNVSANGKTVSWDAVENATSYAVLADGNEIGIVEGAASGQTWFDDEVSFTQGEVKDFYYLNDSSNWIIVRLIYGGALLILNKDNIESNLGLTLEESKVYWLHNDTQLGTGFSYTSDSGKLPWLLDVHYLKVEYAETTNEVFIKFYDTAPTS